MKKLYGKKIICLFVCVVLAAVMMPLAAFADNTKSDSKTTASQSQQINENKEGTEDKEEIKKTEISLGSVYKKVYDGKEISKSDVYALVSTKSGGVTAFTYKWYDADGKKINYNPVNAGTYKLKIQVSEQDPSYTGSATVSYIIEQRPLEWDVSQLKISKPYDGTADAAKIKGYLDIKGVIEGDDAVLAYDSITAADFPTADVQTVSVPVSVENAGITGTSRDNYSLPKTSPTAQASIIKAYIREMSFPDDDKQYRLVVEEAVYVADSLADTEYDSEENIKAALRTKANEALAEKGQVSATFFTPVLQVLQGDEWVEVSQENMPQDNISITLQYPDGTADKSHEFVIYKMKTSGNNAGEIEVWAHTEKVEGIETMLSQGDSFVIAYTAQKKANTAMIIIIGALAVMIIAGTVFFKMHKADKEELDEEAEHTVE
ncbi:MAG: hypothetical protein E7484_03365 [Ruminococcaceae bacterium]|nr:hypothetical protein [Oscillospiraceae bacterium]